MHKMLAADPPLFCTLVCGSVAIARGPFPRLLPPREDFRLTLREEPHSEMPLGPSCSGEASRGIARHTEDGPASTVGSKYWASLLRGNLSFGQGSG